MPLNKDDYDIDTTYEMRFLAENKDTDVQIYLINGNKLECKIVWSDDVCLITTVKGGDKSRHQLVFKSAVATIVPR